MGRAGREFVEIKYDQNRLAERLEKIYEAAVRDEPSLLQSLYNDF